MTSERMSSRMVAAMLVLLSVWAACVTCWLTECQVRLLQIDERAHHAVAEQVSDLAARVVVLENERAANRRTEELLEAQGD